MTAGAAPRAVRTVRWAEAAYVPVALFLAGALPFSYETLGVQAYLLGTAAGALLVAWRIGRGGRAIWFLALLVSVLILAQAALGLVRLLARPVALEPRLAALAYGLIAIVVLAQLAVLGACWSARGLWMRPGAAAPPTA